MKKKDLGKSLIICAVSAIVFLVLTVPFRNRLQLFYVLEVRPSAVLNPVLGMMFGLPAALGCTFGNFALDMIWGGASLGDGIIFMIPQFLYGYVPYLLWKKWNKKDRRPNTIDNVTHVLRFIAATTIATLVLAILVGIAIGRSYGSVETGLNFAFFCFINDVVFNAFLGIPLMIGVNKLITHDKLEHCERLLLWAAGIEAVVVGIIIKASMVMNPGHDLHDQDFWEEIYLVCLAVIAACIIASIVLIAIWMQNRLTEKDYDLSIAAKIQNSMLPDDFTTDENDGYSIYASMTPAKEIGGDFYDFFKVDENHVAFVNADVSGKGTPAALFMMRSAQAIRGYAKLGLPVNEVLEKANESLAEHNEDMYFVTAWVGILNLKSGNISFANAGHNKPVLRKSNGDVSYVNQETGLLMGIKPAKFKTEEIKLDEGDMLFIYTDGVTEARNKNHDMFKEDRLLSSVASADNNPQALCEKVFNDVNEFSYQCEQYDDITMLAIKYERSI
ncbi:MAG: serine/threonine-protein phosphatase [Clostridiales bacterium]|nr:serine/threonine-protein phosphatase [Candidatus Crickella equi]